MHSTWTHWVIDPLPPVVTSDEESEGQEDMWLEGAPLDVFEAETYNVHRTAGVSQGIRGAERNRAPMKPNGPNNRTRRGNLVKGGLRKDTVDPDFGCNMSNVGDRVEAKVPFDVKEDIFDPKNNDDLIPMVVDEGGRNDERKEKGKPVVRRVDGGAGYVDHTGGKGRFTEPVNCE